MQELEHRLRCIFELKVLGNKARELEAVVKRAIWDDDLREALFIVFLLGHEDMYEDELRKGA